MTGKIKNYKMFWKDRSVVNNKILLELKRDFASLKIELESLKLEFDLIVSKLKIKYKITTRDKNKEEEDLKNPVLLPDDGHI